MRMLAGIAVPAGFLGGSPGGIPGGLCGPGLGLLVGAGILGKRPFWRP